MALAIWPEKHVCGAVRGRFMGAIKKLVLGLWVILGVLSQGINGFAYQINEQFPIGGVVAFVYQYQNISDAPGFDNERRGFLTFEPEVAYTPTDSDEVFAKFGIGAGDGLLANGRSFFEITPWGGQC